MQLVQSWQFDTQTQQQCSASWRPLLGDIAEKVHLWYLYDGILALLYLMQGVKGPVGHHLQVAPVQSSVRAAVFSSRVGQLSCFEQVF